MPPIPSRQAGLAVALGLALGLGLVALGMSQNSVAGTALTFPPLAPKTPPHLRAAAYSLDWQPCWLNTAGANIRASASSKGDSVVVNHQEEGMRCTGRPMNHWQPVFTVSAVRGFVYEELVQHTLPDEQALAKLTQIALELEQEGKAVEAMKAWLAALELGQEHSVAWWGFPRAFMEVWELALPELREEAAKTARPPLTARARGRVQCTDEGPPTRDSVYALYSQLGAGQHPAPVVFRFAPEHGTWYALYLAPPGDLKPGKARIWVELGRVPSASVHDFPAGVAIRS